MKETIWKHRYNHSVVSVFV